MTNNDESSKPTGLESANSKLTHIIWDGDNTIWGWLEYAVPAYEAMCEVISKIAGKSFEETASAMKAFYTRVGTMEHEGLVQGLVKDDFFKNTPNFNPEETIRAAQYAFANERRKKLHVYPDIAKVMREFNQQKLIQILLTDAPAGQAMARLRHSKLSGYISRVVAMPTAEISGIPKGFHEHSIHRTDPILQITEHEKPNIDLEQLLKMTREQIAQRVLIIGDNKAKDMALAERYGCIGIHAKYGVAPPDLIERISKFAPEKVAMRNMQIGESPDIETGRIYTARNALEITKILSRQ